MEKDMQREVAKTPLITVFVHKENQFLQSETCKFVKFYH